MLTDLDELMLTVRDPESRAYLREALIAYRGGAYRAAIVSVWVAVVYDIINKIRILASRGEKSAESIVTSLDNAIKNNNLQQLLTIEETILERAHDMFQFVNRLEREDLERIKADRHRCAHPAFSSDNLLFTPTAETVRAHIVHAIKHLMAHPPVQGKAAIDKVLKDISSLSFPRTQQDVDRLMNLRYLDHARDSLVTSLVSILVKSLLKRDIPELLGHHEESLMALVSIANRHPIIYETKMREILPNLGLNLDDTTIPNVFPLLKVEARVWIWIGDATQMQVKGLAENYVFGQGSDAAMLDALGIAPLREIVLANFRALDPMRRFNLIWTNPLPELADEAIALFEESHHFRDAEPRGRLILTMSSCISIDQIRRILKAIPLNYEIWNASQMPNLVLAFFQAVQPHFEHLKDAWEELMTELINKMIIHRESKYKNFQVMLESQGLGPFDREKAKARLDQLASEADEDLPF